MNILTEREKEVLYWISIGLNNRKISEKLNLSIHTIKADIASIYQKLSVSNRVQAVVKCLQLGIGIDMEKKN